MLPLTALELHLPILLATDGCSSIESLQNWLNPVMRLLPAQTSDRPPLSIFKLKSHCTIEPTSIHGLAISADSHTSHQGRRSAVEVLNYAQTISAGCLTVAFQEQSDTAELSNAAVAIARHATCPVLIVRAAHQDDSRAPLSWKHVLLVVNTSEGTRQAIAIAQQLIPAGIEKITVLCVQPPLNTHYLFGPFATPTPSWQLNQSLHEAQREQTQAILRQVQVNLQHPQVTLDSCIQSGEPGLAICQAARQLQADLIIMSNSPIPRFAPTISSPAFQPSPVMPTSDYLVRHAPCPVMLFHTAQPVLLSKAFNLSQTKLRIPRIARAKYSIE